MYRILGYIGIISGVTPVANTYMINAVEHLTKLFVDYARKSYIPPAFMLNTAPIVIPFNSMPLEKRVVQRHTAKPATGQR